MALSTEIGPAIAKGLSLEPCSLLSPHSSTLSPMLPWQCPCGRACGTVFFILLFPCHYAHGHVPANPDSVVMAGSVWGFQACQGHCLHRQRREKGISKGWKLPKNFGNVTKSPLPPVPDETMREMVPWSSGWGLAEERGHLGSFVCSCTQSGATTTRWDWYRKLYTLGARAFRIFSTNCLLTLLNLSSKHRFW